MTAWMPLLITDAQRCALRVAIESFVERMKTEGLGTDAHGAAMAQAYVDRLTEVQQALARLATHPVTLVGRNAVKWENPAPNASQPFVPSPSVDLGRALPTPAPYRCPWCGAPAWREPDEIPCPSDYCHEGDHEAIE